ncbi:MAG: hypothetical protein H6816_16125, partial [Phycisphaerales bacterium]|nr:hypothetical protein [Phycisphaerales bacterium]
MVQLDGSASSDPDGDAITLTWTGDFVEGGGTVTGVSPQVTFSGLGPHVVTLTVDDEKAGPSLDSMTVLIELDVPPCPDADNDGFADANCGGEDCNDADPDSNPDGIESCDGADNDCDGEVDEGTDVELCGASSCTDSGAELGGGSCSATRPTCEAGACVVVESGGVDTCQDGQTVSYWTCNEANDTCVQAVAVRDDSCADSGGALGGGTCQATDWTCVDGLLSSTQSSGIDTCGGTDAAPSVTFYSCNADGNACEVAETVQPDSCTDSGDSLGGGSCAATNWSCTGGALSSSSTGGDDTCGGTDAAPSVTFYSCNADANACEAAETAQSDSCSDSGDSLGGGSCAATDWSCSNGALSSNSSGGDDTCGGTADSPSVSVWACVNGSTCVSNETAMADSCVDTGDASGGGSCAAENWSCAEGLLSLQSSSGVDGCVSEPEPGVVWYSCSSSDGIQADTCQASTAQSCDDGVDCTTDACDEGTGGCISTADDSACNDGDGCTTDTCTEQGCSHVGSEIPCDDGNPCTIDSCDGDSGCTNEPVPDSTGATNCCYARKGPGCEEPACEDCVCAADPYCCEVTWDALCS